MPKNKIFRSKDTEFNDDLVIEVPYLNTNQTRLGISTPNLSILNTLFTNPSVPLNQLGWKEIWLLHSAKSTRTPDVNTELHIRRHQMEVHLRLMFGDIPKSVLTTTDRSTLRLPLRDATPTKIQVVQHAPNGDIESMRHLAHVLRITDPANPHTQEMPNGNKVEVQIAYEDSKATAAARTAVPAPVPPAAAPAERVWTTAEHSPATRFLFSVHFTEAQEGKKAKYRLRYQNERGDKGDWSAEFGAMIS
jgi:hypothetical protein